MDCATAAPFVSMLCDGDAVPDEAARHIAGCADCQARLRDWTEAAARLRLLAVTDRLAPLPQLVLDDAVSVGTPPRRFWRAWMSPVRVPRLAATVMTCALVVSSVGWFRAQTSDRTIYELHYELKWSCMDRGGEVKSVSPGIERVGARTAFFSSNPCQVDHRGLLGIVEPLRVHDGILTLRLGLSLADRWPSGKVTLDPADVHEYEFVSGQSIELPVPGGTPVTFTGTLVQRPDSRNERATIESLLPKSDELAITMPALLRDGRELVVTVNAGGTSKGDHVTALYVPGTGMFLFGLERFDGAREALAGGAALMFEADGHKYTLYSSLPMTAGEQPRRVWVRYLSGYRPSQHGLAVPDDQPSLGTGSLSAYR